MARVTLSGLITDINGSVGGWTFQNSINGKYVRTRPMQTKRVLTHVPDIQLSPTQLKSFWETFTPTEQADWITFAAATAFTDIFGTPRILTGYQFAFTCIFRQAIMGSLTTGLAPFGFTPPAATPTLTLTANATTLDLADAGLYLNVNEIIWIFLSMPTSKITTSDRRIFRITALPGADFTTPIDLASAWETMTTLNYATQVASGSFYIQGFAFICNTAAGICSPASFFSAHN